MGIKFRKHFDYDTEAASNEAVIPADKQGESLTIQSQTDETDINVMMKRFGLVGKLPENPIVPTFGDFSGVKDFATAMQAVVDAEDAFMSFPADVRARFSNDPQRMLEFCDNAANIDEAIRLGLINEEGKKRRQAEIDKLNAPSPTPPTKTA